MYRDFSDSRYANFSPKRVAHFFERKGDPFPRETALEICMENIIELSLDTCESSS